jgi:hypothetical protein
MLTTASPVCVTILLLFLTLFLPVTQCTMYNIISLYFTFCCLHSYPVASFCHPYFTFVRGCIQKFPDWPPGMKTANGTALCHCVQLYRYFMSQSSEFCRHNPLCCFSSSICCYFVIDSVEKLLDTPSHIAAATVFPSCNFTF